LEVPGNAKEYASSSYLAGFGRFGRRAAGHNVPLIVPEFTVNQQPDIAWQSIHLSRHAVRVAGNAVHLAEHEPVGVTLRW